MKISRKFKGLQLVIFTVTILMITTTFAIKYRYESSSSTGFRLSISLEPTIAQAESERCRAAKEAKEYLYNDKYLGLTGGNANGAAQIICSKQGRPLERKCIEWEEKILKQQIQQVEREIKRQCN